MMSEKFHEEIQLFHPIFNFLFLLPVLLFVWAFIQQAFFGIPFGAKPVENIILLTLAFAIAFIPLLFGRMVIAVNKKEVKITFGYLGWIKKRIPISDIKEIEVVEYKPLRQFGGWGIKSGRFRGEKVGCYTMKGNKGILLTSSEPSRVCFIKTNKLIIGSQAPEKLLEAIGKQLSK